MNLQDWMTVEEGKRAQSPARLELRARGAVSDWLERYLIVPNVYFNARWTSSRQVDVLAIDRAGSGDVHVIEIKTSSELRSLRLGINQLLEMPANYRWLALLAAPQERLPVPRLALLNRKDEMGRIGLLAVRQDSEDRLAASIEVPAERFAGSYYDRADRFTKKHKPDLQTRP